MSKVTGSQQRGEDSTSTAPIHEATYPQTFAGIERIQPPPRPANAVEFLRRLLEPTSPSPSCFDTTPSSPEGPVTSTASTYGIANSSHSSDILTEDDELDQGRQASLPEPEDRSPHQTPPESPKLSTNGRSEPAADEGVLRGAVDPAGDDFGQAEVDRLLSTVLAVRVSIELEGVLEAPEAFAASSQLIRGFWYEEQTAAYTLIGQDVRHSIPCDENAGSRIMNLTKNGSLDSVKRIQVVKFHTGQNCTRAKSDGAQRQTTHHHSAPRRE